MLSVVRLAEWDRAERQVGTDRGCLRSPHIRFLLLLGSLWLAVIGTAAGQSNGSSLTDRDRLVEIVSGEHSRPVAKCEALRTISDTSLTIISAESVSPTDGRAALCRVHGVILPEVQFLLELPDSWNGRLYALGNFGYGGESVTGDYGQTERDRAHDLGFATVITNLGHDQTTSPGATWARGTFSRSVDFAIRGLHLTVQAAKRLARTHYGFPPRHSYFDGCSTGGGQGLKTAQRFPYDFDGIAAGAPVLDFVRLQLYGWNNQEAIRETPLTRDKVALLARIILEKYDSQDGVRDGVIANPAAIDFVPARDLPQSENSPTAFSQAEIRALTRIYAGPSLHGRHARTRPSGRSRSGRTDISGVRSAPRSAGIRLDRPLIANASGTVPQRELIETWFKYLAFGHEEPDMTLERFDPERDLPRLSAVMTQMLDAKDPDLSAFRAVGGKLLVYHGWADTGVNPFLTVDYYDHVVRVMGNTVNNFFRLFMVPGMFHCRGGVNVDRFDAMTAVIRWVEHGDAPSQIRASRVENDATVRTRPLCVYPQEARYRGHGSTDDIVNFSCQMPPHQ